jgi:hypothetical protein
MTEQDKINFLENYVEWANERKMFPPKHTPAEYSEYLHHLRNGEIIEKALEMIGKYEFADTGWPKDMIDKLAKILRDEA